MTNSGAVPGSRAITEPTTGVMPGAPTAGVEVAGAAPMGRPDGEAKPSAAPLVAPYTVGPSGVRDPTPDTPMPVAAGGWRALMPVCVASVHGGWLHVDTHT
jgi:hypothetical protein